MPDELPAEAAAEEKPAPETIEKPAESSADAPPAGSVVAAGKKSERELELEEEVSRLERLRIRAEKDAAYHEDENKRLKEAGAVPVVIRHKKPERLKPFFSFED